VDPKFTSFTIFEYAPSSKIGIEPPCQRFVATVEETFIIYSQAVA
jgi:hypothetical protein